jgi:hypothetical protein
VCAKPERSTAAVDQVTELVALRIMLLRIERLSLLKIIATIADGRWREV